jgi:hypothetical protein
VAAAGYTLLFDRASLVYARVQLPRLRWAVPPVVFAVVMLVWMLGVDALFNVRFAMSRAELDRFIATHPTRGAIVGEFGISDIEYSRAGEMNVPTQFGLPEGAVLLYTEVGYGWDVQGLLYSATPPSKSGIPVEHA